MNISNPYLDEIGSFYYDNMLMYSKGHDRFELCRKYAWSITDVNEGNEILDRIPTKDFISIGSGTGYLEWYYSQFGLNFIAFDESPYSNRWSNGNYFPILEGSFEKIKDYPDHNLFLAWYPYNKPLGADCLKTFLDFSNANYTIIIGEERGRCTGDDEMFEILAEKFLNIFEDYQLNWHGIHSYFNIWMKK